MNIEDVAAATMIVMALVVVVVVVLAWMALAGVSLIKLWPWSWSWSLSWQGRPSSSLSLYPASRRRRLRSFNNKFNYRLRTTSLDGVYSTTIADCSSLSIPRNGVPELTEVDLEKFMSYIDETDGGPPWQLLMERSTPTLAYQAWYRDPPFGPTQYRTRTVFQNVSPELARDFFWDDEFRSKWDDMLIYFNPLNVCPQTGTMIVHWIRKLPLFYSDREYVIIRRIWESRSTYYCVTKGTEHPSLPRHRKPKRVDHYYSSWHVKAVESRDQNGRQPTATEVLFFHHEDIGIPKEFVKMGVRAGMWNLVKKLDAGMQDYKMARANGGSPSRYVLLACMTTKVLPSRVSISHLEDNANQKCKHRKRNMVKWLVIGGILIAWGLDTQTRSKRITIDMDMQQEDKQQLA